MQPTPALHRLFVYGTLAEPAVCAGLLGRIPAPATAELRGYARHAVRGEAYPAIVAKSNGLVKGIIYKDISQAELDALDAYEGDEYGRIRVFVETEADQIQAWVYVWTGRKERLGPEA